MIKYEIDIYIILISYRMIPCINFKTPIQTGSSGIIYIAVHYEFLKYLYKLKMT